MALFVTLDAAKQHLHLTIPAGDPEESDLQRKLDAAEAVVLDYLQRAYDPPNAIIEAAILIQCGEFYAFRGDNLETETRAPADGYLLPIVTAILHRLRAWTVA